MDWERVAVQGSEYDTDTSNKITGPVVTQLGLRRNAEMILTLPHDSNEETDGMGAQYVGMELVQMRFGTRKTDIPT